MEPVTIGARIKKARINAGKSNAAQFARDVGIQPHTLWRYEAGKSRPGIDTAASIARELGVSIEWLLTGEGTHEPVVRQGDEDLELRDSEAL